MSMTAKILLIDDDELVAKSLRRLLVGKGHDVETVHNAIDAISRAAVKDFDLVISDIRMPGKNGVETVKAIQESLKAVGKKDLPISLAWLFFLSLLVNGCASTGSTVTRSEKMAVEQKLERQSADFFLNKTTYLTSVGYQILRNLPDAVGSKSTNVLPFLMADLNDSFRRYYGISNDSKGVMIAGVLKGFGFEDLEVSRGDLITRINGQKISSEIEAKKFVRGLSQAQTVTVEIARGNASKTVQAPLINLKLYVPFILDGNTSEIGASVNRNKSIYVTTTLLHFVQNDDELAYVLAREVAHLTEGHFDSGAISFGSPFSISLSQQLKFYSKGFAQQGMTALDTHSFNTGISRKEEIDADFVGLQWIARSGYDPNQAIQFWERLAIETEKTNKQSVYKMEVPSEERLMKMQKAAADQQSLNLKSVENSVEPGITEIDYKKYHIAEAGFAVDAKYFWGNKIKSKRDIFTSEDKQVSWYMIFDRWKKFGDWLGVNFRIEWYRPDGQLYKKEKFDHTFGSSGLVSRTLKLRAAGDPVVGKWRVRVWREGVLIDDRFFWIK